MMSIWSVWRIKSSFYPWRSSFCLQKSEDLCDKENRKWFWWRNAIKRNFKVEQQTNMKNARNWEEKSPKHSMEISNNSSNCTHSHTHTWELQIENLLCSCNGILWRILRWIPWESAQQTKPKMKTEKHIRLQLCYSQLSYALLLYCRCCCCYCSIFHFAWSTWISFKWYKKMVFLLLSIVRICFQFAVACHNNG